MKHPKKVNYNPIDNITDIEAEAMQLWVNGMSREQIAIELGYSVSTINNYFGSVRHKTGSNHMGQMVYRLMKEGVIE